MLNSNLNNKITGSMINYYIVCTKKLWYFSKNISMENNNYNVELGKLLDETTFTKHKKSICINQEINIDFISNKNNNQQPNIVIHEVKKSKALEKASILQSKYYLYYIKKRGIDNISATINYPLVNKKVEIILSQDDCIEIEKIIIDIQNIISQSIPPNVTKKSYCKKCAYFELCYV